MTEELSTPRRGRRLAAVLAGVLALGIVPFAFPAAAQTTALPASQGTATACPVDDGPDNTLGTADDTTEVPEDGFTDVTADNVHEFVIDCIAWYQITSGTSATGYSPALSVRRDQMATFVAQLIDYVADRTEATDDGLPAAPATNLFPCDVETDNVHYANIQRLAEAAIVIGTGDNAAGEACYDPSAPVTRDQMATYIREAQEVVGTPIPNVAEGTDYFFDDDGNPHEGSINAIAGEGIIRGTGQNAAGENAYAPRDNVRRDQMASFLATKLDRLLEDTGVEPPPTATAAADPVVLAATGDTTVDVTVTAVRGEIEAATVSGCGVSATPLVVAAGGQTASEDIVIPDAQDADCQLTVEIDFVDEAAGVFGGTDRTQTIVIDVAADTTTTTPTTAA